MATTKRRRRRKPKKECRFCGADAMAVAMLFVTSDNSICSRCIVLCVQHMSGEDSTFSINEVVNRGMGRHVRTLETPDDV